MTDPTRPLHLTPPADGAAMAGSDARWVFESAHLRCRRLGAADVDALHRVYGDADAMRFVGDGQPLGRADCVEWVAVTERNYARRGYGMFALEDRASGEVLGFAGLVHPGGQEEAELKYALARGAWGLGLATEAAGALLAAAAARFGLREVIATVAPAHLASQRVLAKAGMRPDGVRQNEDGSQTCWFRWQAPG